MTLPLSHNNVAASARGSARLTPQEKKALAAIKDESLRSILAEILQSTRRTQRNFEDIARQFPINNSNLSKRIAVGTVTLEPTEPNTPDSKEATVEHGLGATPRVWLEWLAEGSGTTHVGHRVFEEGETTFKCQANAEANITGNVSFMWLAVV